MLNKLAAIIPSILIAGFSFLGVVGFVWLLGYGAGWLLSLMTIGGL